MKNSSNNQSLKKIEAIEENFEENERSHMHGTETIPNLSPELPEELRKLPKSSLEDVCKQLRFDLIEILSRSGGHFASSLGAVEITVALHWVLNTPEDKIVWDTGHQAYIHKMLTGRKKDLLQIRKLSGISGFPSRDESPFDSFGVAHAGTSISAALGMLEAFEHKAKLENNGPDNKSSRKAVAVIGDGAMTAGMAFEALNHSGELHKNLVVILNDNEMSIAPNVGALSRAFSKAMTGPKSTYARKHFKSLHEKGLIPHSFYRALDRAEEAAKGFLSTPAMLFESFGYKYIGPIDGHNVLTVVDVLERAIAQDGPVLIHCQTVKGKGFSPAEVDPIKWHGVGPFDAKKSQNLKTDSKQKVKTKASNKALTYTDVFGSYIVELAKNKPEVIGITAAMPHGTGLLKLSNEIPEKYYDAGIAEQHAVTFAAGLACEGLKPFCAIYSTFLQRGFDQVLHDVCIQNLPVIFPLDRAGLVGADGPTHHGVFDISYLRPLPNMVIAAPKDEAELKDLMLSALDYGKPVAIRYPRGAGPGADTVRDAKQITLGTSEVLRKAETKSNNKVLILGLGNTVQFSLNAAKSLFSRYGIDCTVLNSRFVKPLDEKTIASLAKEHRMIVSAEDGVIRGGFGSAVLEFLQDKNLLEGKKFLRLGVPDEFIEHGTQEELYKICGFDEESIVQKIAEAQGELTKKTESASLDDIQSISSKLS